MLLQPCCRKSIDEQTNTLLDFLAAENGTVAAGAQKPAETDRRRGDIQQRRRRRRAMLAPWTRCMPSREPRQENDQVKVQSFKIWAIRARSDGCRGPKRLPLFLATSAAAGVGACGHAPGSEHPALLDFLGDINRTRTIRRTPEPRSWRK